MDEIKPTGERVMVVDDEPQLSQMLGEILMKEGYDPVICHHPRDAIEASQSLNFTLAFIDINMPEISGLELAAMLKKENPLREVVFVTGHGTFDNAIQAIKLGAYDYLRKPFSINDLRLCLKRYEERKVLKDKVKFAEQRYYQLVQSLPLLIFVIRKDFSLDFINEDCSIMLGYSPEEAQGTPNWLLERIHEADRERIGNLFDFSFKSGGSPFTSECRLLHKNGQMLHAMIKTIHMSNDGIEEGIEKLEGIIVDITDRVFLEKALVQKEKLKTLGAISAEVAHEIRNPLVALGGFARRLQKKHPNVHECEIILREVERLEKMLDRIRNYLKPEQIRRQECSVNTLVTECIKLLSPEIKQKCFNCVLNLDPEISSIRSDPDALTQVFINLIRNAIEGSAQVGKITVKTYQSEQNIYVDFKNHSPMPIQKDPELLFLPFDEGGESIGLPLSYRLLKRVGGVLSYSHEREQTIFTVSLPKIAESVLSGETIEEVDEAFVAPFNGSENRRYERTRVAWPATLWTAETTIEGTITNISPGGAYICCQDPPDPKETFRLDFRAPGGQRLTATNEAIWLGSQRLGNDDAERGFGSRFLAMSDATHRRLNETVAA